MDVYQKYCQIYCQWSDLRFVLKSTSPRSVSGRSYRSGGYSIWGQFRGFFVLVGAQTNRQTDDDPFRHFLIIFVFSIKCCYLEIRIFMFFVSTTVFFLSPALLFPVCTLNGCWFEMMWKWLCIQIPISKISAFAMCFRCSHSKFQP